LNGLHAAIISGSTTVFFYAGYSSDIVMSRRSRLISAEAQIQNKRR